METLPLQGKKIAVIGSGAIGLYYGGLLNAAGNVVHFLLRADFEAAREKGIRILTRGTKIELPSPLIYREVKDIGECDLVLIGLKTTSNAALESLIAPLLKDSTTILTLQNGLGNEELLQRNFPENRILGGLCFVCLNRIAPGVVEHFGHGTVSIGEHGNLPSEETRRVADAFAHAGVETHLVENLALERWRKLVWNVPFNGLSIAAGNATVDVVLGDPVLRAEAVALMREIIQGAEKLGLRIGQDYADFQIKRSESMGDYKPSSLLDYLAQRSVEVESIWGEPLRQAVNAGAEMPRLSLLYGLLQRLCIG